MNQGMSYWVLKIPLLEEGVHLSILSPSGPDAWRYHETDSLMDDHPVEEASIICFDSNFPGRKTLYDFVSNIDGVLICNEKVKGVLQSLACSDIEYLPVWLQDTEKNIASKEYCIAHVCRAENIIDLEESDYVMGRLITTKMSSIDNLVVDYEGISEGAMLFRATSKPDEFFISDDIKVAFESAGITGFNCFLADDWDGMDF